MKQLFHKLLLTITLIPIFSLNYGASDEEKMLNYYSKNILEMKESFQNEINVDWDVNSVESVIKIYNYDETELGYVICFNKGYIATTKDNVLLKISFNDSFCFKNDNIKIYFYNDKFYNNKIEMMYDITHINYDNYTGAGDFDENILYGLDDVIKKEGFKFTSNCALIPGIKEGEYNYTPGKYIPISYKQIEGSECGVIAIMNLLQTYKFSGVANYTKDLSSEVMRNELRKFTNCANNPINYGMTPGDLFTGCNNFLGNGDIHLNYVDYPTLGAPYDNNHPGICFYHNANLKSGHFAMRVATAQHKYAWIFKTNVDIVLSWYRNFSEDSNGNPKEIYNNLTGYYVVDIKYRQLSYQLNDKLNIVW